MHQSLALAEDALADFSGHAVYALHNIGSTASFLRMVVQCTNYARTLDALGCIHPKDA
jgi:hypothetical protein